MHGCSSETDNQVRDLDVSRILLIYTSCNCLIEGYVLDKPTPLLWNAPNSSVQLLAQASAQLIQGEEAQQPIICLHGGP